MAGIRSNNIEIVVKNEDELDSNRQRPSAEVEAKNGDSSVDADSKKRTSRGKTAKMRSRGRHHPYHDAAVQSGSGRAPSSCVYVSNIPYGFRWQELKDVFRKQVGDVVRVKLHVDDSGSSRGSGVIEMGSPALALQAVEKMHRFQLSGRKLVVRSVSGSGDSGAGALLNGAGDLVLLPPASLASLVDPIVVRGLPDGSVPASMLSVLPTPPPLRPPPAQLPHQQHQLSHQQHQLPHQQHQLPHQQHQQSLADRIPNTYGLSLHFLDSLGIDGPLVERVFVANLDYTVNEERLRELFGVAGRVVDVQLRVDNEGRSRGHGTVCFSHPVEAVQAVSMLHYQEFLGRKLTVRLDRATGTSQSEGASVGSLPSGLAGVGAGLGVHGAPLTDVAHKLQESCAGYSGGPPSQHQSDVPVRRQQGPLLQTPLINNLDRHRGVSMMSAADPGLSCLGSAAPCASLQLSRHNQDTGTLAVPSAPPHRPSLPPQSAVTQPLLHTPVNGVSSPSYNYERQGAVAVEYPHASVTCPSAAQVALAGGSLSAPVSFNLPPPTTPLITAPARLPDTRTVIVNNLEPSYTSRRLGDKYSEIGCVREAVMLATGVGVVQFEQVSDAHRALALTDGCRLDGRILDVKLY